MSYKIKEIYYTLQGEGALTGRPAVFCRFTGCNLWSGHEKDRPDAVCPFCDTDFVGTDGEGGGKFGTPNELASAIAKAWPTDAPRFRRPFVVCTGGEPLLQLDEPLIKALHRQRFEVAIETNGTLPVPSGVDWICMSPKSTTDLVVLTGDELKLVYPQAGLEPERFDDLDFRQFFVQPMDGPDQERNLVLAVQYCLEHVRWKLSLQTHKLVGLR